MTRRSMLQFLLTGIAMPVLLSTPLGYAADAGMHRVVKGVVIYLGTMPGQILQDELQGQTDPAMHGGLPAGEHVYHVMVALFDQATGRRITDAQVAMDLADLADATEPIKHVRLEPMAIGAQLVYGNFVDLPGSGPYRLTVISRLQGMPDTIEAEFNWQHARI